MSQEEEQIETQTKTTWIQDHEQDDQHRGGTEMNIGIPHECSECKFLNFYLWGTMIGGRLYMKMRCMRCGMKVFQERNFS